MPSGPGYTTAVRAYDVQNPPAWASVHYSDLISELFREVEPQETEISLAAPAVMAIATGDGIHRASVIGGYVSLFAGLAGTATFLLHLFA